LVKNVPNERKAISSQTAAVCPIKINI